MQAQVETGILQVARRCVREVQARRRDFRTVGLCGVRQGAAGCADLVSGAVHGQRHTPANFLQAREEFWRIGLFTHHYFHPNTPLLAAQDMHGLMGSVHPRNPVVTGSG
jgi:hypothetical protein